MDLNFPVQTLLSKVCVQIAKSKFSTRLHELYSIFVVVIIRNKNFQMKYVTVILSMYVMVLTAIPCNDVHAANTNSYISPQINRAAKNKSYFYNCYGKEEKCYIKNQG